MLYPTWSEDTLDTEEIDGSEELQKIYKQFQSNGELSVAKIMFGVIRKDCKVLHKEAFDDLAEKIGDCATTNELKAVLVSYLGRKDFEDLSRVIEGLCNTTSITNIELFADYVVESYIYYNEAKERKDECVKCVEEYERKIKDSLLPLWDGVLKTKKKWYRYFF